MWSGREKGGSSYTFLVEDGIWRELELVFFFFICVCVVTVRCYRSISCQKIMSCNEQIVLMQG